MTIFSLLAGGMIFLVLTGIIIAFDNRKRKYKKKTLAFHWRIIGIICTVVSLVFFLQFAGRMRNFDGEEAGDRKLLLRSTTKLTEVTVNTTASKEDITLEKGYEQVVEGITEKTKDIELVYVDALLNKKHLKLDEIREIKYSEDLTAKQVQLVEYLVVEKDGYFTKPGIHYYIIFGQDLLEEKEKAAKKAVAKKSKTSKTTSKKTNSK